MADRTRKRLTGTNQGHRVAVGGWGLVVFGSLFVAVGGLPILIGTRTIEVDPNSVHAPYWVITAVGAVFSLAGLCVVWRGLRGVVRARRLALRAALHPGDPWHADHLWDESGAVDSGGSRVGGGLVGTVVVGLFAAVFWGVADEAGLPFRIAAWVLIGLTAWCFGWFLYQLGRTLKYGRARLEYSSFPYHLGQRLEASWLTPDQLRDFTSVTFRLRLMEERTEVVRRGNKRTQVTIHERLYEDTYTLREGEDLPQMRERIPVMFELPDDLPQNQLRETPLHYWELVVEAVTPGIDYQAQFLLPVYAGTEAWQTPSAAREALPAGS